LLISNAPEQKNLAVNKAYTQDWESMLNLATSVTGSSEYVIAPVYRVVKLGTAYTASEDILDIVLSQTGILVKSKEYDVTTGKYFYTVSLIDGKTLSTEWSHQFEYKPEQVLVHDLNNDEVSEVIINCANVTYVYSGTSGDLLWKYNFSEPILGAPLWDIDNDTLIELFIISQFLYTDVFGLGLYYWKIWITDINTPADQVTYQWLRIPDMAWPYALAVGNWSLTSYYKVAVFYRYGSSITFVDPINLVVENYLILTSSWIETETIVYNDKYILFYDYVSDPGAYRVVNIFNESVKWTYQVEYYERIYLSNFDSSPNPEVLVLADGDIIILNITTGNAISYLIDEEYYYQAFPLDVDRDGLSEVLAFRFLEEPQLFDNTLEPVSDITDCPADIEWGPWNVLPWAADINQDTWYEFFFINITSSAALEVYSLREGVPPQLEILSPVENAYVRGIIKVEVLATDVHSGVSKVEFYIDGKLAYTDYETPYEYLLDTTKLSDGAHTIKVVAYDLVGNLRDSAITIYVDNTPPEILSVEYEENPMSGQEVEVRARVADEVSGVKAVILIYSSDNGATWHNITMQEISSDTYSARIPGHAAGTRIVFKIIAVDKLGNSVISSEYSYTVSWLREMMYGGIGIVIVAAIVGVVFFMRKRQVT